jgi:hypothetical protein
VDSEGISSVVDVDMDPAFDVGVHRFILVLARILASVQYVKQIFFDPRGIRGTQEMVASDVFQHLGRGAISVAYEIELAVVLV